MYANATAAAPASALGTRAPATFAPNTFIEMAWTSFQSSGWDRYPTPNGFRISPSRSRRDSTAKAASSPFNDRGYDCRATSRSPPANSTSPATTSTSIRCRSHTARSATAGGLQTSRSGAPERDDCEQHREQPECHQIRPGVIDGTQSLFDPQDGCRGEARSCGHQRPSGRPRRSLRHDTVRHDQRRPLLIAPVAPHDDRDPDDPHDESNRGEFLAANDAWPATTRPNPKRRFPSGVGPASRNARQQCRTSDRPSSDLTVTADRLMQDVSDGSGVGR